MSSENIITATDETLLVTENLELSGKPSKAEAEPFNDKPQDTQSNNALLNRDKEDEKSIVSKKSSKSRIIEKEEEDLVKTKSSNVLDLTKEEEKATASRKSSKIVDVELVEPSSKTSQMSTQVGQTTDKVHGKEIADEKGEEVIESTSVHRYKSEIQLEEKESIKELKPEDMIEIVEEYEEEVPFEGEEQEGEVPIVETVVKTRTYVIDRKDYVKLKGNNDVYNHFEEYQDEEVDENGEIKKVTKKRLVTKFFEKKEEYEEEEEDDNGELVLVKKVRLTIVPVQKTSVESAMYEDVIEHFRETILTADGLEMEISQSRIVRKKTTIISHIKSGEKRESGEGEEEDEEAFGKGEGEGEEDFESMIVHSERPLAEEEEDETAKLIKKHAKMRKERIRQRRLRQTGKLSDEGREFFEGEEGEEEMGSERSLAEDEELVEEEESLEEEVIEEEESVPETVEEEEAKITPSEELRLAEEEEEKAAMFEKLSKLQQEHVVLKRRQILLTNRIVKYLKDKKMTNMYCAVKDAKDDPSLEDKFIAKLRQFHDMNVHLTDSKDKINHEWETQKEINEDLGEQRRRLMEELISKKREVASNLLNPKTGRPFPCDKRVDDLVARDEHLINELSEWRLTLIKLERHIAAKHAERRGDRDCELQLPDYEKLASLQEDLIDRITQRDIEIEETSKKIGKERDELNLLRERYNSYENEICNEQLRLETITKKLNEKKAALTKLKMAKHRTENKTFQMKQQLGLLAYPRLLKDYEEKQQMVDVISEEIDSLKEQYNKGKLRIEMLKTIVQRKMGGVASLSTFSVASP